LHYVKDVAIVGVGTGSTVKHFINYLADLKADIEGAVSSSEMSTAQLKAVGIPVLDLNAVGTLDVYVDGADEVNPHKYMIKGGGGALTREKIIAAASKKIRLYRRRNQVR
jgi:Ribose 5-phosphate isomerase